jgi:hypothetical protein
LEKSFFEVFCCCRAFLQKISKKKSDKMRGKIFRRTKFIREEKSTMYITQHSSSGTTEGANAKPTSNQLFQFLPRSRLCGNRDTPLGSFGCARG